MEPDCTGSTETCQRHGGECSDCSVRDCPHRDPFHYHHDGCPSCPCVDDARTATCATCGTATMQTYHVGFVHREDGTGGVAGHWTTDSHFAPCGLQCMGGGLRGSDQIRLLRAIPIQVHGARRAPCPRCT